MSTGFSLKKKGHRIVLVYRKLDGDLSGIRTHVSHGSHPKDLDDYLIGQMARQTKLSRKNFERLASCSMRQSEYEETIRDNLYPSLPKVTYVYNPSAHVYKADIMDNSTKNGKRDGVRDQIG